MANRFSLEANIQPTVDEQAAEREGQSLGDTFESSIGDLEPSFDMAGVDGVGGGSRGGRRGSGQRQGRQLMSLAGERNDLLRGIREALSESFVGDGDGGGRGIIGTIKSVIIGGAGGVTAGGGGLGAGGAGKLLKMFRGLGGLRGLVPGAIGGRTAGEDGQFRFEEEGSPTQRLIGLFSDAGTALGEAIGFEWPSSPDWIDDLSAWADKSAPSWIGDITDWADVSGPGWLSDLTDWTDVDAPGWVSDLSEWGDVNTPGWVQDLLNVFGSDGDGGGPRNTSGPADQGGPFSGNVRNGAPFDDGARNRAEDTRSADPTINVDAPIEIDPDSIVDDITRALEPAIETAVQQYARNELVRGVTNEL